VVVWLVVGGITGAFPGRLAEVQKNDNASFLPSNAEATEVAQLQRRFEDKLVNPTVVVYERRSGITAADRAKAAADVAALQQQAAVVDTIPPVLASQDGQALEIVVPLSGDLGDKVIASVDALRATVTRGKPPGLAVHVAGPGAVAADFVKAFGGIDGVLLVVALAVVLLILVSVYRSPVLPVVVLLSAVFALSLASAVIYGFADSGAVTLDAQGQGILFILVVGAATDYSLLLVSRYREELREQRSRFTAMQVALRQSWAPIVASGITVVLGVLCLLFSDLKSNRGLGPVAAIGIVSCLAAALTFLPALLTLLGRTAFWPQQPRFGSRHPEVRGVWGRAARLVERHPRRLWIGITLVLLAMTALVPTLKASGVEQTKVFLTEEESVAGQRVLSAHFPAGVGSPVVVVGPAAALKQLLATTAAVRGVAAAYPVPVSLTAAPGTAGSEPKVVDGLVQVEGVLSAPSDSTAADRALVQLRRALHRAVPGTKVGGFTAIQHDVQRTAQRDRTVILPIVLAVILLVLMLLLRAVLAPVLLILTVALSFSATMGASALVFNHLFHFPGSDPAVVLFGFVFLVALGIDYNIFLMTRVREESVRLGTRPGIVRGLTLTGGVITSAGVVLAATFAALGVIPILFLAQMAFIVSFGVLLDTLVVRSLLVPALSYDLGRLVWWPHRLSRATDEEPGLS
jgi:RND superfamily putative drug exporter